MRPGFIIQKSDSSHGDPFQANIVFSIKNPLKSFKIMNKCLGDARGIPRGIPGAAPGHPRGSPGAPGDPRSTAGAPRGKGASRDPLLGTHFPSKLAQMIVPVHEKRGPGIRRPQSNSVKLDQTQSNSVSDSQCQPAVLGKVVPRPRPGTTLLHAPGTKMT